MAWLPFSVAQAQASVGGDTPLVISVALAPVPTPEKVSVENRGGPLSLFAGLGCLADKTIQNDRVAKLKTLLSQQGFNPQEELRADLLKAFEAEGIKLGEEDIKYVVDDPYAIDYHNSVDAQEHILQVAMPNLGLFSGYTTTKFLPRLNVSVDLVERKTEKTLFSKWFYYGADAKSDWDDQVTSPPDCAYADFEAAVAHIDQLTGAYRAGLGKISQMVAKQVKAQLASARSPM